MNNVAAFSRQAGLRERALELITSSRDGFQAWLGPHHPYSLAATANLANCLTEHDELEAAEVLERKVVETFGATLGPDHPDALAAAANRAITLRAMDRAAEAEGLAGRRRWRCWSGSLVPSTGTGALWWLGGGWTSIWSRSRREVGCLSSLFVVPGGCLCFCLTAGGDRPARTGRAAPSTGH